MPNPISNIPILLFPLKLETRFVKDELWIRAFPDEAFLQSHDPKLTLEEHQDAKAFKKLNSKEQKENMWEEFVSKYGVYRASWLVQISNKELDIQVPDDALIEEEPTFYFKWLPDRLVFYVYKEGDQEPTYEGDGSLIDRDGLIVLGEGDEWLQDFDKSILVGMGIKIKIDPKDTKFEKVIVSGFRHDDDPLIPAKGLTDLFSNHQYTEGLSFLPHGTPTNNTENAKSGHSAKEEFTVGDSFDYAVEGLDLTTAASDTSIPNIHSITAGKYLSNSLGFEPKDLMHVQHADQKPSKLNELYQKASWFALGAQPLFMLFGNQISSEMHESIWQHYTQYVKSRGLYSALKIGNQPYGILPVMNISKVLLPENKNVRESDQLFDKMTVLFARLMKRWILMVKGDQQQVPRLKGNDTYEDVLKLLSMQEASSSYQIRALQYNSFKRKLYDFLEHRPNQIPIVDFIKGMGKDYDRAKGTSTSLQALLEVGNEVLSDQLPSALDQFLRAPLLSLVDANSDLIGFQDGHSVIIDKEDGTKTKEAVDAFSFAEENLGVFQKFITALKERQDDALIQYHGELSVFTDLFYRSFANASQLYSREVTFELKLSDTSALSQNFKGATILKNEGSTVKKGDPVIEILDGNSKKITVKAPFDGKIQKVLISEGAKPRIAPGMELFTLVNEKKHGQIKNAFINLGQQIIDANNAIVEPEHRKSAQKKAIGEAIDLNSYRLDAWVTSLAASRIAAMRTNPEHAKGIYFGAYGWIEDLERDQTPVDPNSLTDIYREEGGILHSPGAPQTVASSVFKNSFLSHKHELQSNPFAVNLSSDRLQKSQLLLEGIRQGQQLEALLGYQLERHLHEDNLHTEIYALRKKFPLHENVTATANGKTTGFANLSVIDGLKAIQAKNGLPTSLKKVKPHIEKLEDTMDACLDTLFYEAGYQITQGNISQAAAAIDATKGEIEPPIIESIKTRIPGTGMNHKLVMVFPTATKQYPLENTRAFVAPHLEKWLEEHLGPMTKIGCMVELYNPQNDALLDTVGIPLADLKLGYLDLLYLSDDEVSDGASELELRIRNAVLKRKDDLPEDTKFVITNQEPENGRALGQALECLRYAKAMISKCRYLKSDDLSLEDEIIVNDRQTLVEINEKRLFPLIKRLKEIANADLTQESNLALLSKLNFESAKTALLDNTSIDTDKLKASITAKIATAEESLSKFNAELPFHTAFEALEQGAKALFGDHFILLPPALGSGNFTKVIKGKKQQLLIGDPKDDTVDQVWGQERIKNWVQGVAQVHENSELFEDWLMVDAAWNESEGVSKKMGFKVVQGPTLLQYPWVALSQQEIDLVIENQYSSQTIYADPSGEGTYPLADGRYYPENCDSVVLYGPENISLDKPVFGLVIEEFSEHIPNKKLDTGLSFNYNTPNNEPPQAILLAVHPKATLKNDFFWSEKDLRDILYDTIDLYKIRMVDIEAIQEYGYVLPMTYWFNLPTNK